MIFVGWTDITFYSVRWLIAIGESAADTTHTYGGLILYCIDKSVKHCLTKTIGVWLVILTIENEITFFTPWNMC